MIAPKYVYLEKEEYVNTWVNGGVIPIEPVTKYRVLEEAERVGTQTPDEALVHKSPFPLDQLRKYGFGVTSCKSVTYINCSSSVGGVFTQIPNIINAAYYLQNGLVLCLSNSISEERARLFGNRRYVVRIEKVDQMFEHLSGHLGIEGQIGPCHYTKSHQRDAFQKSFKDEWQDEYRMFWPEQNPTTRFIKIPAGLCQLERTFDFEVK